MYSHLESTNEILKLKNYIPYSKYVCGNIMTSYNIINRYITDDSKIIVPGHFKSLFQNVNYEVDNIESFQCQISGKCKINEPFINAAQREVFEEIGLFLNKTDFKEIHREIHSYKNGKNNEDIHNTVVYYLVNVDNIEIQKDNLLKLEIETNSLIKDDYERRVVIFAYTQDLNLCNESLINRKRIKQYGIEEQSCTGKYIFLPTKSIILNSLLKIKDYWEYRRFVYNRRHRF